MELYIYCTTAFQTRILRSLYGLLLIALTVIKCQAEVTPDSSPTLLTGERSFSALMNAEQTRLISTTITHSMDSTIRKLPSTHHSSNSEPRLTSGLPNNDHLTKSPTSLSTPKSIHPTASLKNDSHTSTAKIKDPETGAVHSPDTATESPGQNDNWNDTTDSEAIEKDRFYWTTPLIIGVGCGGAVIIVITVMLLVCILHKRKSKSKAKIHYSNYWDDTVTLSYINNHIELPRDINDEMISLDDDSFLHSLDNMSFTNLWTADGSKRTTF